MPVRSAPLLTHLQACTLLLLLCALALAPLFPTLLLGRCGCADFSEPECVFDPLCGRASSFQYHRHARPRSAETSRLLQHVVCHGRFSMPTCGRCPQLPILPRQPCFSSHFVTSQRPTPTCRGERAPDAAAVAISTVAASHAIFAMAVPIALKFCLPPWKQRR